MQNNDTLSSFGLLVLRVAFGCFMLVHGIPKLMGFNDMAATFPDPIGIGSQLSLIAVIGAEVGCSILIMLGLGTRVAALPLAFTMIVALFIIHRSDPWQKKELAALYLTVYAVLVFTGAGRFSLDHLIWKRKRNPTADDDQ